MLEVYKLIGRVAASDVTALVLGESGTGKELVAHAIHAFSGRSGGPLNKVNLLDIRRRLLYEKLTELDMN